MNIKELFDVETAIPFEVEGHTITFHLRNPTSEEELEFRRRTTKQRIKENGTFESTEVALKAPLWLFDKICKKVILSNATGQVDEVSGEDRKHIPDQLKLDAIAVHRNRIKKKEDEELRD